MNPKDNLPAQIDASYDRLAARESELWGQAKGDLPISWFDSPLIYRYINLRISGHPDVDCLDYFKQSYLDAPLPLCLTVGCGHGELERLLIQRGIADQVHGFDISSQAVESAREQAEAAGLADRITYFTADANRLDQAPLAEQYDAVVVFMALHHIAELRACLEQLRERLRPGGWLLANEFIGPYRFQWTDAQLDITNRLLACLPAELTRNLRKPDEIKRYVERPTLEFMETYMAFESITSHEIVPAMQDLFEMVESKYYGGGILHLLFEAIMGNYQEERVREHAVIIRLLTAMEGILLDYGVLQHDHALLLARKPA